MFYELAEAIALTFAAPHLLMIRVVNLRCFTCRMSARECAAQEGREVADDEGLHPYYAAISLN
ncbi:MAG: hypothetical protein IVW56_04590 [Candidatus Binataceae bacterium]|nr:hypothetical protein [Candidatus Binataceae bacterium]